MESLESTSSASRPPTRRCDSAAGAVTDRTCSTSAWASSDFGASELTTLIR